MVLSDTVMGYTSDWCNPESSAAACAEGETEEASTLDPSYIIHLLRQLLPDIHREAGQTRLVDQRKEPGVPLTEEEVGGAVLNKCREDQPPHFAGKPHGDCETLPVKQGELSRDDEQCGSETAPSTSVDGVGDGGSGGVDVALEGLSKVEETVEVKEDPREEAGCVLWDLAASKCHADFLVENHVLDVLLGILQIPQSDRMREICLGILGNLACHLGPERAMVATQGLLETVVLQLYVDDSPSLTETCRLLSAGLHSEVASTWVEALKSEDTLERIMWISGNTLNPQLLEKQSSELLLAMVDSQTDASTVLLPILLKLRLPELLTDLLSCELSTITCNTPSRGDVVLDIVLQIAEALSISDDYATQLAANPKLFSLACEVIRLSSRDEIGPSGITAAVLVANLLSEEAGLINEVSGDAVLSKHLFFLLPSAGEDPGARNALWSILNRICKCMGATPLQKANARQEQVLQVFADGSCALVEDLDTHREEDMREEQRALAGYDAAAITSRGLQAKLATASHIIAIMEQWTALQGDNAGEDAVAAQSLKSACHLLRHQVDKIKRRCADELDIARAEQNGSTHPIC